MPNQALRFAKTTLSVLLLSYTLTAANTAEPLKCPEGPPRHIVIEKGEYVPRPGVTLHMENFVADLVPRGKQMPYCLKNDTYVLRGRVYVDSAALTRIFNQKLGANKKIQDISVKTSGQKLNIGGKVHKLIPLHFEIEGPLNPVERGLVDMHADSIHADGIPAKGLLEMFGKDLGDMVGQPSTNGVKVEENTVRFDVEQLLQMHGEITRVQVLPQGVALEFGTKKGASRVRTVNISKK
jgi:hypothetical protein